MIRTELINKAVEASNPPDEDMRRRTRAYFEGLSDEDIQKQYADFIGATDLEEQKEATRREREKLRIYQTSGLANIPVNDRELDRQLPGGLLTLETFASLIQNDDIKVKFIWQSQPFQRAKQARAKRTEADRENFLTAARELLASPCDANLNLVVSALGSGFSSYAIKAAVANGSIQLLAASPEELAEFHRQTVQDHQDMLKRLALKGDISTLRLLAQQEADANRRSVPQAQGELNLAAIKERDSHRGYPALPKSVTKFQIQSASQDYTKTLVQKYGKYQLLSRLMEAGE
jgi:hypothetical protein